MHGDIGEMKKWIISLAIILILCGIRFTDPWFLDMVRMKALDQHQRNQTQESLSNLVTVEINNETLNKKGQWPWDRNALSAEVIKLYQKGAGLVVLPILFADEDRFGKDAVLARTLKRTPTIIGQIPTNDEVNTAIVRGFAAVGKSWKGWVYQYPGALGPIPELAENANAVGMMVIAPEKDGVVRRMPLVIAVNDELYPSISLEVLRMAAGDISYQIKTGIAGVEKVRIPKFKTIETDVHGNIWLDFKWKTPTYALHEELPDLTGQIVIVSMTASGLDSPVPTPVGVIHSHDLIGASLATMMTGRNITRPYWTNVGELGASFGLALVIMVVVLLLPWYFGAALMPASIIGLFYGSSYLFTKHDLLVDWSYPVLTIFVAWAIAAFLRFMEEHKKRMEIKKQFEHYLAPAMVKKLQKNPDLLKLGGDTRELTLLFCDIRGFTPISEQFKTDPQGLTKLMNKRSISVIVPVYNSEQTLVALHKRLNSVCTKLAGEFEIIFVNDGSIDGSWQEIQNVAKIDSSVVAINLMKNYGQHNAVLCGIRQAIHEIVITMDDDLQNPPEEIPNLLEKLNEGYDVIYGMPEKKGHGYMRNFGSVFTKIPILTRLPSLYPVIS